MTGGGLQALHARDRARSPAGNMLDVADKSAVRLAYLEARDVRHLRRFEKQGLEARIVLDTR